MRPKFVFFLHLPFTMLIQLFFSRRYRELADMAATAQRSNGPSSFFAGLMVSFGFA